MQIRMKKGQTTSNMLFVIVGIVIAVIVITVILRVVFSFFGNNNDSINKFNLLSDQLTRFSDEANDFSSDNAFIHLDYSESIIFFDNNSKGVVKLSGINFVKTEFDPISGNFNDFIISNKEDLLSFFLTKRFSADNLETKKALDAPLNFHKIIFVKPASCGVDACAVLCSEVTINAINKEQAKYYLNEDLKEIPLDNFYLASCVSNDLRVFKNINHFYIKPRIELKAPYAKQNKDVFEKAVLANLDPQFLRVYFSGAMISVPVQYFSSKKNALWPVTFSSGTSYYFFGDVASDTLLYIVEQPYASKKSVVTFDKNPYLSFVKVDNDIVFCYELPCLTKNETEYFALKHDITSCVAGVNCELFRMRLVDLFSQSTGAKKVFTKNNKIKIQQGDLISTFDKPVELSIIKDGDAEVKVNEINFEFENTKLRRLIIKENDNIYGLIDLRLRQKQEGETLPVIQFIFEKIN